MVRKRDEAAPAPGRSRAASCRSASIPRCSATPARRSTSAAYDFALAGSPYRFGDYEIGEKIDHVDGMTVEEAEHQIATRLYQNTARVHFNQFTESKGRFGRRLIYGGHVISLARALSFNGLANAFHVAAINGGRQSRRCSPAARCCLVGGAGEGRAAGPQRCRRAAPAHRRDEGPAVRGFPAQGGRGRRPGRDPRSRLLGATCRVERSQCVVAGGDHAAGDAAAGIPGWIALVSRRLVA